MATDRDLLAGLLAFQCGFVSKEQLLTAMRRQQTDARRSIESILIDDSYLGPKQGELLGELVEDLLSRFDRNEVKSLASLSSIGSLRQELEGLGDDRLNATLAHVGHPSHDDSTSALREGAANAPPTQRGTPRYRTLRLHAKGGLGEVYVAQDEELHREVALKEIQERFADEEESRARFKLEAEITGNLEHPGIVPVYGLGQYEDGRPFYAMRFIRGDSLKEAIEKFHGKYPVQLTGGEAGLELRKLLRRFVDVCNAIAYAHSRGVLHRDLKPGNIILGKYGETLVVDWGLAKAQGSSTFTDAGLGPVNPSSGSGSTPTLLGSAIGTPMYMSPEQAAGKNDELTASTDVYSLGATLFHLLTGQYPISGKGPLEILRCALQGDIRRPREVRGDVPKALEAICQKSMAKETTARYATPTNLAEDIERWLADEPVSAYAEPLLVKAQRWIRQRPALTSAVTACTLLTLAGALFVAYLRGAHARELEGKNEKLGQQNQLIGQQKSDLERSNAALILAKNTAEKAQQQAVAEKEIAVRNLQFAKKGNEILGSVFASLDPNSNYTSLGELTIVLAGNLRTAVQELESAELGDPQTVAQLQNTLGVSLIGLGETELGASTLEKARKAFEQLRGPDDESSLAATTNLAQAYLLRGEYSQAKTLLQEGLERYRKTRGVDHEETIGCMGKLAHALTMLGEYSQAIPLIEEAFQQTKSKRGPDHLETLVHMNTLAMAYYSSEEYEKALPLLEEVLTRRKETLTLTHPHTLNSLNNLAMAHQAMGNLEKAMPLYVESLERTRDLHGQKHPDTLSGMNNLAFGYLKLGNLKEAQPLLEKTLELRRAVLTDDHPQTLNSMLNLAACYAQMGKRAEALPLYAECLQRRKAVLGEGHGATMAARSNYAFVLLEDPADRLGEPLLDEYIEQLRQRPDLSDEQFAGTLATLANRLLSIKRYDSAAKFARTCLALRLQHEPDVWTTFNTQSMLGASLLGQKNLKEAEPLLLAGFEGMKKREAGIPLESRIRLIEATERLVALYTALEKPEELAKWTATLAEMRDKLKPAEGDAPGK